MKLFRKIKGKLGFTLAEMLIVVAILAILTAVAAPNVAKYSRSINLRELNDSARAIYMAAEHKFMNEIEMGNELPGLDDGAAKITALLPRYDETSEVDIFYLKSNDSGSPLKKLMSSGGTDVESTGVVESQLFDNNFIVEYNPKTGDVYGVFYSEKENFDDYTTNFYSDVADVQSKKLIGYYGLMNEKPDAHPVVQEIEKPTVEVINKEKLVVRITAPSGTIDRFYVKADVDGTSIIPDSGRYMSGGQTVELVLDCLDGPAYAPSINEGPLVDKYEASADVWGISCDGADKTLTVSFYDNNGIARDQSVTKTFNPLFANGSTAGTAYIEYGRHLQNLDKCSAITTAVIKKTINFASTDSEAGEFGGWATYYSDFITLVKCKALNISARSGAEIQNISIITNPDDKYYAGLFAELSGKATDLTFRNPTVKGSVAGPLCGYTTSATVENVKVINLKVESDNTAGGLIGMDMGSTISGCSVYVETDKNVTSWEDPTNDPYSNYKIEGQFYGGGLIGVTMKTIVENSYAAVKVKGISVAAGGLIGMSSSVTTIEDSFAAGHTYYGIYQGNAKDGKVVNLKDNVSGKVAGGLVGDGQGDGDIILKGVVFSSCSVTGTLSDPLYVINYEKDKSSKAEIDPGATVYTLGTAYKTDGATVTEIKKSADTNVKTGDDVKVDDSLAAVGKRYDLKVSSVYKYPVPHDMTMHGDWPSSDAVTGFFYWEKEVADDAHSYHIQALWYGNGKPDELINDLCKEQDGHNVTDYGYGAFSVGGSLDSAVTFSDGTSTDVTNADVESAVQTALAAVDDLKITDSGTVAVKLYNVTGVSGTGFVTATVGGNDYTFAPDFYAISADKGSDHAGTDANVFGVRSDSHLKNVKSYPAGIFEQSHDINYKDDTTGLTPIGDSTNKFTGTYNGGSYRIIDAKFNTTEGSDYAGLFGVTDGATLENIVLFNEAAAADKFVEIKGKTVGVIVADARGTGTIENCVASGYEITGEEFSGGIAGKASGMIKNSHAVVKFNNVKGCVGGIAGENSSGSIYSCYAIVHGYSKGDDVTGPDVGGILGKGDIEVTNCYSMFRNLPIKGSAIANNSSHKSSTNVYVNSTGFCPSARNINNAKGVLYDQLAASLDGSSNSEKTYTASATDYARKGEEGAYAYKAVTTDLADGGKPVHYGIIPEKISTADDLIRGPVAGVFDVNTYSYFGGIKTSQFDGYLTYNRSGTINEYEAWDNTKEGEQKVEIGDDYIGVFFCNPGFFTPKEGGDDLSEFKEDMVIKYADEDGREINDSRIEVYVNGAKIDHKYLMPFDEYMKTKQSINLDGYGARSGYYHFTSTSGEDKITDQFFAGHQSGTNVNSAFRLFVILKEDGTRYEKADVNSIQIKFTPDGGEQGTLIKADNLGHDRLKAELPSTAVDTLVPPPKVVVFMAATNDKIHTSEMPKYIAPYYAIARSTGTDIAYGELGNQAGSQGYLGVLIPKEYIGYAESQTLLVNVCGAPARLEVWGQGTEGSVQADIANLGSIAEHYEISLDDYEIYYITNVTASSRNDGLNGGHSVAVQFGTKRIFYYAYSDFKANPQAADKDLMPDFVLATLYTNASGTAHYAKGFKAGAKTYPPEESGSDNNSAQYPTTKTNSYVFITTGSTSDFTVRINGNTFVDIGEETDMVTNLTWHFSGKAYTINILGDDVDSIEVYYKGELIMTKSAGEF